MSPFPRGRLRDVGVGLLLADAFLAVVVGLVVLLVPAGLVPAGARPWGLLLLALGVVGMAVAWGPLRGGRGWALASQWVWPVVWFGWAVVAGGGALAVPGAVAVALGAGILGVAGVALARAGWGGEQAAGAGA